MRLSTFDFTRFISAWRSGILLIRLPSRPPRTLRLSRRSRVPYGLRELVPPVA